MPNARAEAPEAGAASFYRYRDASGRVVIVDSLARVPASQRAAAEAVTLAPPAGAAPPAALGEAATGAASATRAASAELARELHWPSFIAGASAALACALLLALLGRKLGPVLRTGLVLGAVALGAAAYFGWVRRTAGQGAELLASPATLIDDARAQVEKMNQRSREQERVLKELEHAP